MDSKYISVLLLQTHYFQKQINIYLMPIPSLVFEKPFSYTFCGTCNSQIQRLRKADKEAQKAHQIKENDNEVNSLEDSSNEKEVGNENNKESSFFPIELVDSDSEEEDDDNIEEDEGDSDLEEIKVHVIVKSKDIKVPTAKNLTIEPVNYEEISEKINSIVQKTLRKKIKPKDYTVSYKAVNARGSSIELEDELDFQDFIGEYKKIILGGKKMSIIVNVKDTAKKKDSNNKHKKSSDESGVSSAEEINELQRTKKKKLRAIREEDLSKEERTRSEIISTLCEIYKCNLHTTPCFIQDNRHLQLNPARLQLWAREIANKGTTYEIPPSYPTFDVKSSSVKNNLITQAPPTTPTPIFIQMPSQFYQNPSSQEKSTSYNLASPNSLPSIGEFLNSLDQKHKCNTYTNFENAFLEEEITVNVIKDLSDEQLQKLGVVKIGWQKNIKQAAQQF